MVKKLRDGHMATVIFEKNGKKVRKQVDTQDSSAIRKVAKP
jgi:hypothetical protein